VREGLTNVVRHSRARRCSIHLGPTWIEVVDDGIGPSGGLGGGGLRTVRERVAEVGGTVEAGLVGRGGWRLRVEVPALRVDALADDGVPGEAYDGPGVPEPRP
jgi:two-component system sensor histidine kinase DesK